MPATPPASVTTRTVGVASPHFRATRLAEEAIRGGANAIEAALTAAVALTVLYPHQCSLGGDLVALVRDSKRDVRSVISVGAAAQATDASAIPGDGRRMLGRGAHTITVPGIVAGWMAIAGPDYAPALARAFRAAAQIAEDGEPVSRGLARALESTWGVIGTDPGMRSVFSRDGEPLIEGDLLRQPQLAHTLRELADDPNGFYSGAVARRVAEGLERAGSPVDERDLRSHVVHEEAPLSLTRGGVTWSVAPPPSQGIAFLALRASEPGEANAGGAKASLIERAIVAAGVRDALLADVGDDGVAVSLDDFLSAIAAADRVLPDPGVVRPAGDTMAISAVDSDGLAVTIVQSIYQTFGSGICDPATGIVFHNRGAAFSLDPAHPAYIRPGHRPPHTLTPVFAESESGDVTAMGCQGGRAQPWILGQLADRLIDADEDLTSSLSADRWIFGAQDIDQPAPAIVVEGAVVPDDMLAAGARRGWDAVALGRRVDVAGHVQVVRSVRGRIEAATDPRADGAARVILSEPTSVGNIAVT
ncbi:gamma-glutamyltransferase [soil metagenome]